MLVFSVSLCPHLHTFRTSAYFCCILRILAAVLFFLAAFCLSLLQFVHFPSRFPARYDSILELRISWLVVKTD